ncbi:MAG: Smr/MutS family protein, partial [Lachnospiraceae bacterium]|nr:Smr/MutS family protein [Lachnospiraceae bacterium]
EIEAILAHLSELAAGHAAELETDLTVLSKLDFIFAKASLARDMDAVMPEFNTERRIVLKSARHPLLPRSTVVPIDLTLGQDFHQLIVTGPNTGGKTVSLKTVGLLQLMGQAGLHIPALPGSELAVFTQVYADIGDEQSIEQSLSTFSSHMKNIVGILKHADSDSLVLLDELCSGTDPQEGAALAIAILKFLHRFEIRTMATTHYSELKLYALSSPGVENASCEFDVATLSPTYRLLIGIPGKSNAFAISRRLGLPPYIIEDARKGIDEDAARFEDIIKDLNDSRRQMERERSKIGQLKGEAKKLNEELKTRQDRLAAEREAILKKAREEARSILQEAKDQVDETIRQINKAGRDPRELEKVRAGTRELLDKNTETVAKTERKSKTKADELHLGDRVRVLSMNLEGTVSSLPDARGNLFVQMGILRSQVRLSDVEKLAEQTVSYKGAPVGGTSAGSLSHAMTISHEINLIGKTVDEALSDLGKYLDEAYLSHLPSVRIVHGKGSGALRNAVHGYLRKQSFIKGFHLGEYGEGDAGVTIAEFK